MIEIQNISKSFGDNLVNDDISLTFNRGQTNLIIGASGSGKSVLTKCIVALHEVDKGNVLYDVTYDDGDFEEGMKPQYVRRSSKSKPKTDVEKEKRKDANLLKIKKQKAKKKAR